MTSTPVKDAVGSILTNMTSAAGNRAAGISANGFQAVLNNQTQRNTESQNTESRPSENRSAAKTKPGDSLKPKEADRVQQPKETKEFLNGNEGEEMTPEELEEVMAVLETAAVELIQQVADLLEIPVEEVQGIMKDLGLENLNILEPKQLSALFLQAANVEDSYALLTDEGLYENYQTLMAQLETTVQECSQQIDVDPVQLPELLSKLPEMFQERPVVQSEAPVLEVSEEKYTVENELPGVDEMTVQDDTSVNVQKEVTADSGENEQKKSDSDDAEPQSGNLFMQNLRAEGFRPEVQQTVESASLAESESTENIMRQIMDYMKVQLKADTTSLEMQLHPASLGTVQVQIASKGGVVTANFIAQNEAVKAALETQMPQLMERFEEQGVKVEAIEVTVQTHEFERNLEQGRGRGQQNDEPAKKGRTRRINLNDAVSMEDMEEEDVLAADMMAANGSTVDYTA